MNVGVGSLNAVKLAGVKDAFEALKIRAEILGIKCVSLVSSQPLSLEEIAEGARNRARSSLGEHDISIGIESGIFRVNGVYFDACHAALYDGRVFYEGGGPYFEVPERIAKQLIEDKFELGRFFDGKAGGAIGALTKGIVKRREQVKYAVIMAVSRFNNREYS